MKGCPKCAAKKAAAAPHVKAKPLIETINKTVTYQKDTVVSREIIRRKNGTVTVFAFDAGQGLSQHTAPFDALVQVLDGAVEIRIDGKPHRLRAGQMIVMPEGRPHALKALTRFKMMLTMIKS
ncbi:MAG: cupin domain-containing protein [Candidatus Edwardsbacteria bacterium]|jgi:quercetin dioxygenase-like cupin family protein|nr:cupin domain-containing protein [Candidatus Edwardsbacteria bacterium]